MLWNLLGYLESLGPGPVNTFVILDEAHRLSFDEGSPVEKMGVMPGDLIRAVNQKKTAQMRAFSKAIEKLELTEGVVLDINRRGNPMYLSYSESE